MHAYGVVCFSSLLCGELCGVPTPWRCCPSLVSFTPNFWGFTACLFCGSLGFWPFLGSWFWWPCWFCCLLCWLWVSLIVELLPSSRSRTGENIANKTSAGGR